MASSSPNILHSVTEFARASVGVMATVANAPWALPWSLRSTPNGDGQPVMLLPGFGASGKTLYAVKAFLEAKGYSVYTWDQGTNKGPKHVTLDNVAEKLREISKAHGGAPVHLVGQSLGGTYSLALASYTKGENLIKSIITLGSPVNPEMVDKSTDGANAAAAFLFNHLNPEDHADVVKFTQAALDINDDVLADIPVSCLYSKYDGVVAEDASKTHMTGDNKENIDISPFAHIQMGFGHLINFIIGDRLGQDPDNWQPYDKNSPINSILFGPNFRTPGKAL